jgi:hypothetical protein
VLVLLAIPWSARYRTSAASTMRAMFAA